MGKVTEHLIDLITKQIEANGIVVWYDPERVYSKLVEKISIPGMTLLRYEDSFFGLRSRIEPFLEFVDENGKPRPESETPPRLLVYVPKARPETRYALVEAEHAGVVMEPGANPWQRNTRLRVVAEQVFKKIAPDSVQDIRRQIDDGLLNLDELDRLSLEVEGIATGTIKIIFGTASAVDVALAFIASDKYDEAIRNKRAMPELSALLKGELGIELSPDARPEDARQSLQRIVLITELLTGLPEDARPEAFSSIPIPRRRTQIDKVLNLCKVWRNRLDYQEAYVQAAKSVEQELSLVSLPNSADMLTELETFPFLASKLFGLAEQYILKGRPEDALELSGKRKASFWSHQEPVYQLWWRLIEQGARVIISARRVEEEIKGMDRDPAEMVRRYAEGSAPWCFLDTNYRHLEAQYASLDLDLEGDHDDLEKVIARVRQDYTSAIECSIEAFLKALVDSDFEIKGLQPQKNIFSLNVLPHLKGDERVAYLLVDALRFEMGKELGGGLVEEFEVNVSPYVGQLPTITSVGMAALMPGAEKGLELIEAQGGKAAVMVGSSVLKDRSSRMKYLEKFLDKKLFICKLNDLIKPSRKTQSQIRQADFVVVTSQEIDRLAEEAEAEAEVRLYMDEVLEKLRRAIRRLASLGITHMVVAADHGHLFGEAIESGMKMDPPGGKTIELHRRVWIGKGGIQGDGFIRVSASDIGLGGDLELAFPRSLACFKVKGGSTAYFHGGISLQEMVIPVICLSRKEVEPFREKGARVELALAKAKVTTRFFSVTATYFAEGLFGPEEIRVRIMIRSKGKEVGFAAMSAYGFEEGTKEITLHKEKPNAITIMLTEVQDLKSVSVHVVDASSQAELARLEKIPVDISI